MAFRGITYSKQSVSSKDDSHIYRVLLGGKDGKTRGCKMTFGTDDIYISDGYFFASGKLVEITSAETVSTPIVSSGTSYCKLVYETDLSKTNTNTEFKQGSFKILTSSTGYPAITQEDLESGGNIYQLPFARFTKTVEGIGSFVSELETIGFASDSTIYVSKSGNDASGDGSASLPFATIQHAIDSIPKDIGDREIIIDIAAGTYSEDVVISGFSGAPLRFNVAAITISSLSVYDSCVILNGSTITIAANGKTYGLYCHRDSNVICQTDLVINGSDNGIYCGYASRLTARKTTTINSCTFAVSCMFGAIAYIVNLGGSKNNNAIQAAGGIVFLGTIAAAMASTMYVTTAGGRIFTGSQASVPSY